MFSVIFPGQGSQSVGMGKEIYDKYQLVKELFKEANDILNFDLSKLIFEGPKDDLDLTLNTQPAIFLVSYSIFNVIKKEHNIDLNKANFFAGHSLGEYSALACAGYLNFSDALRILRLRGEAMQSSVPKGVGGMLAILGTTTENIENIINENSKNFTVQIANDNSDGQLVVSGKIDDLKKMIDVLKTNSIKNIQLPVSAPFHCALMNKATDVIFFSADQKRMNLLPETIKYNQKTYAYGKIVVWDKSANSDFNKQLAIKKLTESKKIALANPKLARYQQPRLYIRVEALPAGPNAKLLRRDLSLPKE